MVCSVKRILSLNATVSKHKADKKEEEGMWSGLKRNKCEKKK